MVPAADQPEAEEALVHLPVLFDQPGQALWDGEIPRRRLREKTAIPQLSMLCMEGEERVQRWLQSHQDQFDPIATMPLEDAALRTMEVSSDSWTIETPERTSSSSSEGEASQQTQNDEGLKEVDWHGGGEWEGAPNNQDGGSRLVAPQKHPLLGRLHNPGFESFD